MLVYHLGKTNETNYKKVYDNYVLKIEKITWFVVDFLWAAFAIQWSIHLQIMPLSPSHTIENGEFWTSSNLSPEDADVPTSVVFLTQNFRNLGEFS